MFNKMKCVRYLPNILVFVLLKKATSLMKMSMQHLGGLTRDGALSFSLFTKKDKLAFIISARDMTHGERRRYEQK
jgi:hypothetical protein